jgi:hypothetical protein
MLEIQEDDVSSTYIEVDDDNTLVNMNIIITELQNFSLEAYIDFVDNFSYNCLESLCNYGLLTHRLR